MIQNRAIIDRKRQSVALTWLNSRKDMRRSKTTSGRKVMVLTIYDNSESNI